MTPDDSPQIHIDSDWKAEAQAEKEKLAAAERDKEASAASDPKKLPPANFQGLVGILASQAVMGLGAVPDESGKGVLIDLDGAKFAIDLLAVLEEKTSGNLTDDEAREVATVLTELRARFVQVTQLIAQQVTQPADAPDAKSGPGIVMPD
ncbi:MAG: DUF1844 domain-containing protein [Phycisphaerales bacterium]|jgi:hypothetical protein|nr:DUF1844 domain-containing protein [Phycisphaerales bacterium]